ncbi:MAG TPA: DUF3526 domain-containing protein [Archangium sp.]|nr:DUF3526 domain-containing protein [Archangium sp.]
MSGGWRSARYELRHLLASPAALAGTVLLLAAGLCAIGLGTARTGAEREALATREARLAEQEAHLRSTHAPEDEVGLIAYYLALPTANEPSTWAGLATGLRDVYPSSQSLRLLGLVPQLHEPELSNPLQQLTGGFDLAFVLVFLLPLLIIGLSYDVLSGEEDLGTGPLLRAQPTRLSRVVLLRLGLRAGLVAALVLVLLAAALVWSRSPLDGRALGWALISLAYTALWFLVALLVASLRRPSTFNALALVSLWIGWSVLVPSLINLVLSAYFPVPGGVELTLVQRQEMNAGWDKPKRATMEPFLARRPEWALLQVPEERFSWTWYYAMHEVGDGAVAGHMAAYRERLQERQRWAEHISLLLPPVNAQLMLDRLSGTDMGSQLAYRDSLIAYHEQLKRFFYPKIFRGERLSALDFSAIPRHRFVPEGGGPSRGLAGLLATLALLGALVPRACRRMDEPTTP